MTTVHSTVAERLGRLGVDDRALLGWAEAFGASLRNAWEGCARGDWRVWLAATAGVEPRALVRAASACAARALERIAMQDGRPGQALRDVEAWLAGGSGHELDGRADAAEAAAERTAYREAAPPGARHAGQAAAWASRAAAAANTAEVRSSFVRASAEAGRLTRWMRAQSFYDALLPAESGALEHAMADDAAYAAAAAAEAVLAAARAMAEADAGSVDDALARCDRVVAERIPRPAFEAALEG